MSYLLDKKTKRKKFLQYAFFVLVFLILFYFRKSIFNGFSYVIHTIFRPALTVGNSISEKFSGLDSFFVSKNSLYLQNENLKSQLNENEAQMANYNSVVAENTNLKEILGRKNEKLPVILSAILGRPNQSLYDTIIIDAGTKEGLKTGDLVFVLGNIPIGRIAEIYANSSKVILFSNPGEKTQVVVGDKPASTSPSLGGNIFMEVTGRGGGNFEMIIPEGLNLTKGDQITLPGITPYVLAVVETIISDPRNSFVKALLVSPINVQELKFVEVEQ